MSSKRYTEAFKIEATKQVTERNYRLSEVAARLGISAPTLRHWVKKYGSTRFQHHTINDQQEELRKLKSELRRVTEERDILKEAAAYFAAESKKSTRS